MTKIIGLTGGIASGKSTVTKIIRESGFKVIDADQVVHKLQAKGGKLYQALLEWVPRYLMLMVSWIDQSFLK